MKIAIIIPVFNETSALPRLLGQLTDIERYPFDASDLAKDHRIDILFADGGSTDATVSMIQHAGFRVITTDKGRASQMNAGAQHTRSDVLLFLHADTQLPSRALCEIRKGLTDGICWGRFNLRIDGKPWMLSVVAQMINWRSRFSGIATGDQALFMTRDAYDMVGGFPSQALMEDIEISKRLKHLSRPACVALPVITSGRRWETRGVWKTIFLMWRLRWAYWRGAHPTALAKLYV